MHDPYTRRPEIDAALLLSYIKAGHGSVYFRDFIAIHGEDALPGCLNDDAANDR
jgi:hypothetical protein